MKNKNGYLSYFIIIFLVFIQVVTVIFIFMDYYADKNYREEKIKFDDNHESNNSYKPNIDYDAMLQLKYLKKIFGDRRK